MDVLVKGSAVQEYLNYLIPIDYAFQPRLRGRLTLI